MTDIFGRGQKNLVRAGLCIVGLVYVMFSAVPPAGGQGVQVGAAISGRVEDPSGGSVEGATVTVKSLETGATRTVTTDESGNFRAVGLPLGPQELLGRKAGFKARSVRESIWRWGRKSP